MPKEVISNAAGDEHVEVRWYNFPDKITGTYVEPVVAVGVGRKQELVIDGVIYKTMYFNLESPEQVDAFIKNLRRAKRKVFGEN